MKKIVIAALAVLFTGNAMALDNIPASGLTWQGIVGMNVSNISNVGAINEDPKGYNAKVGLDIGIKAEYMLPNAKGTYINAGVDWSMKGARKTFKGEDGGKSVIHAHYLNIPVHVGYRYNITSKYGVYADLGPYFAIGVTGKAKWKPEDDSEKDTHDMTFGKWGTDFEDINGNPIGKTKVFQRFDCGFGFRVGAEYNNQYSINFGWDWGITDASKDSFRKIFKDNYDVKMPKLKNHNFALTFGYRF